MDALSTIPDLTDLELATLLSLAASSHCIVTGTNTTDLASELALIAERFGLSHAILDASSYTSAEAFVAAAVEANPTEITLRDRLASVEFKPTSAPKLEHRMLKHVVIAKDFDGACEDVQIQAVEVITNRRATTRDTVYSVPRPFLFIPVLREGRALGRHLNDWMVMSHRHEGGFANLEGDAAPIDPGLVEVVRERGKAASVTAEVRRYAQDVVTFLRLARGVEGVSPRATGWFVEMSKYLAPLHGIDYVTPALVGLAARKVYRHRVRISVDKERSLRYGSDPWAVAEVLEGMTADDVIEEVLATVPCPK